VSFHYERLIKHHSSTISHLHFYSIRLFTLTILHFWQIARGDNPQYSGKCRHLTLEDQQKLEAEGRKPSIRFKVPQGSVYSFDDMVKGHVSFESDGIGDHVIVKKDGIPTYNFAVTIDDHLMEMSHVLRGDDHISNTPKQLMIYEAFGWEPPIFGHMTLIVNESRKKLSKRDESIIQFIEQYEELGYIPEALFNFITLLGWSPEGEEEIFSKEEFINIFDPNRLSKSPALFDKQKLAWMNNQYMKQIELDRVVEFALPHLIKSGCVKESRTEEENAWVRELIALNQERMSYGAEIVELSELFFNEEVRVDEEAKEILAEEQVPEVLSAFLTEIENLESYTAEEIKKAGRPMIEYTLPDDEVKRWQQIGGEPFWEEWVATQEKAGHPEAREILNTVLNLCETYNP